MREGRLAQHNVDRAFSLPFHGIQKALGGGRGGGSGGGRGRGGGGGNQAGMVRGFLAVMSGAGQQASIKNVTLPNHTQPQAQAHLPHLPHPPTPTPTPTPTLKPTPTPTTSGLEFSGKVPTSATPAKHTHKYSLTCSITTSGLEFSGKLPMTAPALRPHSASCSAAAARNVSPGIKYTCSQGKG